MSDKPTDAERRAWISRHQKDFVGDESFSTVWELSWVGANMDKKDERIKSLEAELDRLTKYSAATITELRVENERLERVNKELDFTLSVYIDKNEILEARLSRVGGEVNALACVFDRFREYADDIAHTGGGFTKEEVWSWVERLRKSLR